MLSVEVRVVVIVIDVVPSTTPIVVNPLTA